MVSYSSPYVPCEWIEAHGLRAQRLTPDCAPAAGQGVCPFAAAWAASARGAVVMTTTCDQLRRTAEIMQRDGATVFLMNVPATWGQGARELYREELLRMGRWLVQLGGVAPTMERLREEMVKARRHEGTEARSDAEDTRSSIPLGLVGGPLRRADHWIYELIKASGACVALDAMEMGERGLPAAIDERGLEQDPLGELVRMYFDGIPDAFRRPDVQLHDYLRRSVRQRGVKGMVLVRYLWCDQWHAQLQRIRESAGVPVVEIDLGGGEGSVERARTRIESLVEMLR